MRTITTLRRVVLLSALCGALGGQAGAASRGGGGDADAGKASAAKAKRAARTRRILRRVLDPSKAGRRLPVSFEIGGETYVSRQEYLDLRNGAVELLKRYPPDKYFFVGLGRDPAPVIAFLQNLGEKELAVNLPGTSNIGWANQQLADRDVARYIEAAIPANILKGERQIVILDVTSTGKTPAVFGPYLDRYLAQHGNRKKSIKLGFSDQDIMHGSYGAQLTDWIDSSQWEDFQQYPWGKYEGGVSEHERTVMQAGGSPPKETRPEYDAFRKAVLQRMQQDKELDAFVAKLNPNAKIKASRPPPPPKPWFPRIQMAFREGAARPPKGPAFSIENPRFEELAQKIEKTQAKVDEGDESAKEKLAEYKGRPAEPKTYSYLANGEYEQLRDGALSLLRAGEGTPDKKFYVGVGRSSGAMVAFLENLGADVGTYLPLDGLHKFAADGAGPDSLDWGTKAKLFELFDRFLPEEILDGQRTVVLFQQSETGASLPFAEALMKEYFLQRGSEAKVEVVSLSSAAPESGVPWIDVAGWPEMTQLNSGKYLEIAPYGFYRPDRVKSSEDDVLDDSRQPKQRRKIFGRFKTALGKRMKADPKLAEVVPALFPARPEPSAKDRGKAAARDGKGKKAE